MVICYSSRGNSEGKLQDIGGSFRQKHENGETEMGTGEEGELEQEGEKGEGKGMCRNKRMREGEEA